MHISSNLNRRILLALSICILLITSIYLPACGDSRSEPDSAFIANSTFGAVPFEVSFEDHSIGEIDNWNWDFDSDGTTDSTERNPTFIYSKAGTYSVSLTVEGPGGSDTKQKTEYITITSIPSRLEFAVQNTSGIVPLEVKFTNYSTMDFTSWAWDLNGDGIKDSSKHSPSYTYTIPGLYTPTLTATGPSGEFTKSRTVTVFPRANADFIAIPTSGTASLQVQFLDRSVGKINYWSWDFNNDGIVDSTKQHPVWTFQSPQEYTVTLTAGGAFDADTEVKQDYIRVVAQGVDFRAEPTAGIAPLSVQFFDESTIPATDWQWDFDNNGEVDSTEQNPTHTYDIAGFYTVSLTAVAAEDTMTETKVNFINIATPSIAEFEAQPTRGPSPLEVQFFDHSSGEINSWFWDFDNDGVVDSTEQYPIHTYEQQGSYTVTLTINGPGGSSTETKQDYITVGDWMTFRHDNLHTGTSVYEGPRGNPILNYYYQTQGYVDKAPYLRSSATIASDDTIYVGSGDGNLYALNPDGSLQWNFQTNQWVFSTPAIGSSDGTIYFGSQAGYSGWFSTPNPAGQDGTLWALNPDGTFKWRFETDGWVMSSPVIASDGTILFGSGNGVFYALNPDGSLRWVYNTEEWILSSPAIGRDGTIYIGSQGISTSFNNHQSGHLWAFDINGNLLWNYYSDKGVFASPAIGDDNTIYFGTAKGRYTDSASGELIAINPDGSLKWTYYCPGEWVLSSPAVYQDTVYFGSQAAPASWRSIVSPHSQPGKVRAVYTHNGSLKWEYDTQGWVMSSPTIDALGTVYFGSGDGNIYAIYQDTGTIKWIYSVGSPITSSPTISERVILFIAGNRIYALGGDGIVE